MDVERSKILPDYRTDYSQKLNLGNFVTGYWKFNNSSLKDTTYVEEIKELIKLS